MAKSDYLSGVTRLMEVQWPANRTINIVCHGHSVPAGYFQDCVVDTFHAYPHLLHRGLKARFPYAVINVIVSAIGGDTSAGGRRRFRRDALAHRPDVVTIDFGLNDRRIGLEPAREAWAEMIAQAEARRAKIILLTPTGDTTADLDDPDDSLNQHAEQIRLLARLHRTALVDSLALFKARVKAGASLESLMSTYNHPNAQGHELVAEGLLKLFP